MNKYINKNREKYRKKANVFKRLKFIALNLFCLLVFVGIFSLYVMQVNLVTPKTYEAQDLRGKIETLKEQNEKINLQIAELKSLEKLENRIAQLNLVKSEDIVYLEDKDVMVAVSNY